VADISSRVAGSIADANKTRSSIFADQREIKKSDLEAMF
jgi:hypothetical protein